MTYILKKHINNYTAPVGAYNTLNELVNAAVRAAMLSKGKVPVFSVEAVENHELKGGIKQ